MDKILLTIGTPTYNGCQALDINLTNTFALLDKYYLVHPEAEHNIEVLVSNNASPDDTHNVCQKFIDRKEFRYIKNENNIGADRNFDNVVKCAKGKYVWILSDDEMIVGDDTISMILNLLEAHEPSYVYVNYNLFKDLAFNDKDFDIFNDINDFYSACKFYNSLISTNIFKKEIWENIGMEKYFDTSFIHIGYPIHALDQKYIHNAIVIYKGCTKNIVANIKRIGANEGFTWIKLSVHYLEIYKELDQTNANKQTKSLAYYSFMKQCPKIIIFGRAKGFVFTQDFINRLYNASQEHMDFYNKNVYPYITMNKFLIYIYYIIYDAPNIIKRWRHRAYCVLTSSEKRKYYLDVIIKKFKQKEIKKEIW